MAVVKARKTEEASIPSNKQLYHNCLYLKQVLRLLLSLCNVNCGGLIPIALQNTVNKNTIYSVTYNEAADRKPSTRNMITPHPLGMIYTSM